MKMGRGPRVTSLAFSGVAGPIVAGPLGGHVSGGMACALAPVAEQISLVFGSRTGNGTTLTSAYSFGGADIQSVKNSLPVGWLSPRSTRVLIVSPLASNRAPCEHRGAFSSPVDAVSGGRA
jgi:L-asparaginase/Glu-tRNA(Gln) amidotransferase subunit D